MTPEEYKKYLYNPKQNKYALLGAIKQEGNYQKIKKIYRLFSQNNFVKSVMKSNAKPTQFENIRSQKDGNYSGNLIGELSWMLLCLEHNADIVRSFLELRKGFEANMLLGKYEEARHNLSSIESTCGKSIWLIEATFLLEEYEKGVEDNWRYLSEVSQKILDPIALISSEQLSKRAEAKVSYFRFNNSFSNQIDELISHRGVWEYFNFKLNPFNVDNYTLLSYIVSLENSSPLIDRFFTIKQVLYHLFHRNVEIGKSVLLEFYTKLHELFPEDTEVLQILSLLDIKYLPKLPRLPEVEELFEKYHRSQYSEVLTGVEGLITTYPACIELYELYSRSLIEIDSPTERIKISPIADQILDTIYNVYSSAQDFEHNWDISLKLGISFYSTAWARQYLDVIKSAVSVNSVNKHFSLDFIAFSSMMNPRCLYFADVADVREYSEVLRQKMSAPISITVAESILLGEGDKINQIPVLSKERSNVYSVRSKMRSRQFLEAKEIIEATLNRADELSIISKEEYLVHLYRCYLQLDFIQDACLLFVDNYLENNRLVKRFNTTKLLDKLDALSEEGMSGIELPIFLKIATSDSYKQYVGFDTYLTFENVTRPTELLDRVSSETAKLIFFLREVCTIEVMHHSYHFEGTEDIENERIKILNRLIVIDPKSEPTYIQELSELNQSESIRKVMREVNKGRISVNVKQLRDSESQNIKEAFSRLKEIENYAKNRDIVGVDTSNLISEINISELEDFDRNKIVYTSDPAFISFRSIFIEIRDKFLLSKEYGLDGYLSTRIRHGTFLNHIRSVFESLNIISQRDKEGNYLDNEFWNSALFSSYEKIGLIQNSIKSFSQKIDSFTDSIIKDYLQVRTEKYTKKPNGLFNYSLTSQDVGFLFTVARDQIKDHNTFVNFIFEFLEEKTEFVLSDVRKYLLSEIKDTYDSFLSGFYEELAVIFEGSVHSDLKNSITLCGTSLQQELSNIAEWFHLSNTSKDVVLDLKVLIQTAVQITNNIYPNFVIKPSIIQTEKVPLAGTAHLIYVFRILFDNIITHSGMEPEKLEVFVRTETVGSDLKLSFRNNISPDIDIDLLRTKLQKVNDKWRNNVGAFDKVDVEGDSGFDKIRRIIVFDLEIMRYSFEYIIEDNYVEIIVSLSIPKILKYETEENTDNRG